MSGGFNVQYKVKLTGVSKQYTLYRTNTEKLLDILTPKSMKKEKQRNFYALRDIYIEIKDGETIGVVGINGSGKSTISNLLSHVIPPTTGQIDINGEPSLIAINVGLNNNLSGYDNIELKLLMHGFSRSEVEQLTPSIEDFADIGDFMNQPVKKYSSGMKSRLGFAISVHTHPDLLIVDEALSVGDKTFYQKCLDKINEFKAQGKTIIFISHSIGQIKSISDRVLWLHNGELKEFGDTKTVIEHYEEYINWFNKLSNEEKQLHKEELKEKRSTLVAPNQMEKKLEEKPYDPDILPSRYTPKKKKLNSKNKKRFNLAFPLQLSIFILAFIISGFLLVSPSIGTSDSNENDEDIADFVEVEEVVELVFFDEEKEGYIAVEEAALYQDKSLTVEDTVLPFASELKVIGEYTEKNSYIIERNNTEQYIEKDMAILTDTQVDEPNLSMEEVVGILPERFGDSYLYFLNFLGESKETTLPLLRGVDEGEVVDSDGYSYTFIPHESFWMKFDQSEILNTIIVENIDFEASNISNEELETNQFFIIGQYKIIVNVDDKMMGVQRNN